MRRALEPVPLLAAAVLGAAALSALECWVLRPRGYWEHPPKVTLMLGAGVGVIVQLGVRLTGLS